MDAYDAAVVHFTEHPEMIADAWQKPSKKPYGYLFQYLSPDGTFEYLADGRQCGCPSLIQTTFEKKAIALQRELTLDEQEETWLDDAVGYTDEITEIVRASGVPPFFSSLTPEYQVTRLDEFAKVQRETDRILGRTPPTVPTPQEA